MKRTLFTAAVIAATAQLVTTALAVDVLPGDPAWATSGNSGGGSSAITATEPRSGNGSLELTGDRTRFTGLGNPFDPLSNLGLLSSVTDLRFEWSVAVGSVGSGAGAAPSYSPALRIHIWDGTQRSELIWENAYNGNGSAVQGTWYSSGSADNFWRFVSGPGGGDSGIYNRTIAQWSSLGYSPTAYIAAISVGVGSSAGPGYRAFADNVVLDLGAGPITYNFEAFADQDGDGVADGVDNCPTTANPDQTDDDFDGVGNACDICPGGDDNLDTDGDSLPDGCDPCPYLANMNTPGCTATKKDCQDFLKLEKKDFEEDQKAAKKAFDDAQKQAKKDFVGTKAQKKAFEDQQKLAKKVFDDGQKADKDAFHEQQKAQKKECKALPGPNGDEGDEEDEG
jgi:hypothetical protein